MTHQLIIEDNTGNRETLTRLWNRLALRGRDPILLWANPDTIPAPEWDVRMMAAFQLPNVALVGPATNHGHPGQREGVPRMPLPPTWEELDRIAEERKDLPVVDTDLTGFWMAARRDVWLRLRGFDERFRLYGQDSEFSWRVREEAKMRTVCARSAFVWHQGSASVRMAAAHGEINQRAEATHSALLYRDLINRKLTPWNRLPHRTVGPRIEAP